MAQIEIRKANPGQPAARALLHQHRSYLATIYAPEEIFTPDDASLNTEGVCFWLGYIDDVAMGCVALLGLPDYGEVKSLFVHPDARKSGLGAALLNQTISHATDQPYGWLRLETGHELAAASRLYQRAGFRICGPFGDYRAVPTSVFMERDV